MEYIFGVNEGVEILKVRGSVHAELTGYRQIERKYPDQTIIDNFRVVRKIDSKEDGEGNCYDWYEIDNHYRFADRTSPVREQAEQNAAAIGTLEDALCEMDAANAASIASLEDALCEMDMGGASDE